MRALLDYLGFFEKRFLSLSRRVEHDFSGTLRKLIRLEGFPNLRRRCDFELPDMSDLVGRNLQTNTTLAAVFYF